MSRPAKIVLVPQEAAEYSGIAVGTIRRAIANGELPSILSGKSKRYIHKDEFDKWLHGKYEAPQEPVQGIRRIR